jgi:glycosyltransferase involved in cell wall biosynthesis
VDDASRDASLAKARAWLRSHPTVPALLVRHTANRGLGRARNTGVAFARGEYVFVLDADNVLYPHGIERLVSALDADPEAEFAYGLLEQFTSEGSFGLMGVLPWEPARLRTGNYIDAMALIRTRTLRELPYSTDPRLHGYEDWALWCAIAERGGRGALVREIVARYRLAQHSMARTTSVLSVTDAFSVLSERYPRLFAGVEPPL